MEEPPSFARTTALLAGLLLRRFLNRFQLKLWGKRWAGPPPLVRTATARKKSGGGVGTLVLLGIFAFNAVTLSSSIMDGLQASAGPVRDELGRAEIPRRTYDLLRSYRQTYGAQIPAGMVRYAIAEEHGTNYRAWKENYAGPWVQAYEEGGLEAFVPRDHLPSAWESPPLRALLLRCLGVILLAFAAMRYFWSLGTQNQDLGRVEWSTEWLFTMPASAEKLFGAQILGHALVDPFSWIATIPFLSTIYFQAGLGWGWLALAAIWNSLCLSVIMASLRVGTETFLRKRMAPARLKNLQALFTVIGICLLFFVMALGRSPQLLRWVVVAARPSRSWLIWNPFSLPAAAFALPPVPALGLELAAAAAICSGMVRCCARLVREGLIMTPSTFAGKRTAAGAGRDFLPAGIIGKDLRLLLRDRNFCVQTLVAPLLVVGFQVFFNSGLAGVVYSDFHRAAAFAFGVGAYVLISTGLSVLSVEGNALWMLYALPVPLHRIMLRKTLLWAALAALYTGTTLAVCGIHLGLRGGDLACALAALAGVVIFAFIAAGCGMLGTDPLEVEVKRRIRPGMTYLYMTLALIYGTVMYASPPWGLAAAVVGFTLFACALWERVKTRSPFLLDASPRGK